MDERPDFLKTQTSIEVNINTEVFKSVIDYYNITSDRLEMYKIQFNKNSPVVKTTIARLRKLSTYLNIPVSAFFGETPPPLDELPTDHRTLSKDQELDKNAINAIRNAEWKQSILNEIYGLTNLFNVRYTFENDPIVAGQEVALIIGFDDLRNKSKSPEILLRELRYKLEEYNIFTMKFRFKINQMRGFSLSSQEPPMIGISFYDIDEGRIFTVLHELGHILIGQPGISEGVVDDVVQLSDNPVERWCDYFAAAITVPREKLKELKGQVSDENYRIKIRELARDLLISKHSAAISLLEAELISYKTYQKYISTSYFSKDKDKDSIPEDVIVPYKHRVISKEGKRFVSLIMDAYRSKEINHSVAMDLLNISENSESTFDELLIDY